MELRERLGRLQDHEWVKASYIMYEITHLLGHSGGPMGGSIQPRACKYCRYFGHTRQWCPKRIAHDKAREERECEAILEEDRQLREALKVIKVKEPYDPTKTGQAKTFDELGIPYTIHPDCGPIVAAPNDTTAGKWSY